MAKIKIEDLPVLESLSTDEVKEIFGGSDSTLATASTGEVLLPGGGVLPVSSPPPSSSTSSGTSGTGGYPSKMPTG